MILSTIKKDKNVNWKTIVSINFSFTKGLALHIYIIYKSIIRNKKDISIYQHKHFFLAEIFISKIQSKFLSFFPQCQKFLEISSILIKHSEKNTSHEIQSRKKNHTCLILQIYVSLVKKVLQKKEFIILYQFLSKINIYSVC
jgi:hypothetical protein